MLLTVVKTRAVPRVAAAVMEPTVSTTTTLYRAQLTLERGAMINQLYALGQQPHGVGLREQIRGQLRRIDHDLQRIAQGEHVVCDHCGAPHSGEQLQQLAIDAVVCRSCERQLQ